MFIVLDVYDDKLFDYRTRHVMIGAGTQFYPTDYKDIELGTTIDNNGTLLEVKEPIDVVALKINAVYLDAYNIFVNDMESITKRVGQNKKKRTTRK